MAILAPSARFRLGFGSMRLSTLIAWLAGLALLAGLVILDDPMRLLGRIAAVGWWLPLIILWHGLPVALDARAWQLLFTPPPPPLTPLIRAIWIGEGLNGLFPVPHLGEIVRARLAARLSRPGEGAATVVVDMTLGVATELVFALIGVALFAALAPRIGALRYLLPALALASGGALAFFFLQRAGLFLIAGRIARRWSTLARRRLDLGTVEALDDSVRALYRRRGPLLRAAIWRLAGWIAGAGETWLIFRAMGQPIGFGDAIIIESLGHVARTAAFFIPGGLGVVDGAFLLLASALGLGPDAGLALALVKRLRALVLGLPALAAGYAVEARHYLRRDTAKIEG
jgi:putative membrane protein